MTNHYDFQVNAWVGTQRTVLGLIGDTPIVDMGYTVAQDLVESVKRVQKPYEEANRKFHPDDTATTLPDGQKIGDGLLTLIVSPCSVEDEEQICGIAERVKAAGTEFLRGGAFESCISPYSFQGMKVGGLELLSEAKRETGLPVVIEIIRVLHLELLEDVDIIQVDTYNIQNFELLKELDEINKPILLRCGLSSTIEELLMSAKYIMTGSNKQVTLCERDICTFEPYTRNMLDISAMPVPKKLSHLPVVVNPSHAGSIAWLVEPLAITTVAAGANGLIIEAHNDPPHALSGSTQSLTPDQFDRVSPRLFEVGKTFGKTR